MEEGKLKFVKTWIEEIDGEMKECTMYTTTIRGKTFTATNRRPHVSPEQRAINDAKICQILYNVLGPSKYAQDNT